MRVRAALGAACVATLVAACGDGSASDEPEAAATTTETVTTTPAPRGNERGEIVSKDLLAQVDPSIGALGASQYRITYRSTSGLDGSGTVVSGSVFVPPGAPPAGGWSVVSVGHGTTGVTDECAPSLYPNLLGNISMVTPTLERGAVVVVSDFQGLGTDGPHPYLDPASAAFDMIDAVRAARNVVPDASAKWGAMGTSQGGQASWAAAEAAGSYGDGLDFVGSANLSPAADLSAMFAPDADGRSNLTASQKVLVPFIFQGFQAWNPDAQESDYLHGAVEANKATLLSCTGPLAADKFLAAGAIGPDDTEPSTPAAREAIIEWLTETALPQLPADGPMMTLVGGRDDLVLPEWTEAATRAACALGDSIDFRARPEQEHADAAAVMEGVDWLSDRFAGVPPVNSCSGVS